MKLIRKNISGAIIFLGVIILLPFFYDDTIKHPFDSPSPSASGKLFYLFLHYLDKFLGRFGVFAFFVFWFLLFLYKGIKWEKEK